MTKSMKIGEVANLSDVSVQTVRYYESLNLLSKPVRTPTGYRIYNTEAVQRIRFIRKSQELGFNLNEIKELLDLRIQNTDQCHRVKSKVGNKLEDVRRKISELQTLEKTLMKIYGLCESAKVTDACPVLDILENDNENRINLRHDMSECCGD